MQVATSTSEGCNPETLLAQIAAGDKNAESFLVNNYYRGLLFIINRQAKNFTLAEDIAQDTFVVVLQKARQSAIHNPSGLSAFIRQTGINLLIGHYRKESRRDTHGVDDISIHPPSDDLDISRILYSKQSMQLTNQIIEELTVVRDREILRDFFVYDKNKEQICEEMELKPEHFDRVLFRARQRLKQLIHHKLGSSSNKESNLLNIAVLAGLLIYFSGKDNYFTDHVGDSFAIQHLPFGTPTTSSRYMPTTELCVCR